MSVNQQPLTVREAVGVFKSAENLQAAIDDLLQSGFHRAELSLLASEQAVEEKLGHQYRKVSSFADDPLIPRAAYVSPEAIGGAEGGLIGVLMYVGAMAAAGAIVASGGTLTAVIVGAAPDRRRGGPHRLDSGQVGRRGPCPAFAAASGSWRPSAVGTHMDPPARRARHQHSQEAFR